MSKYALSLQQYMWGIKMSATPRRTMSFFLLQRGEAKDTKWVGAEKTIKLIKSVKKSPEVAEIKVV